MRTTKPLAVLFASLLLFGAAACSSDSDDETSTEDASAQDDGATSGDDSSSSGDDSSSSGDDSSSSGDDSSSSDDIPDLGNLDDCLEASAAFLQITLIPLGAAFGGSEEDMAELEQSLEELDASIPDEVSDDYQIVREAYADYAEAMGGLDLSGDPTALLDPDVADQLEEASAALEDPEVVEAQENIQAYFEELCGS